MCKDPEERTHLVSSKKKCGLSRLRELKGDKIGETKAGEMCQTTNAKVRDLDFI